MEDILINIDSRYRNIELYPEESKFKIKLDEKYKNIINITLESIEINHCVHYLNNNNISDLKNNNYFTLHIPNKLNDPDGSIILLNNGYSRTINTMKKNINNNLNIFNNSFNTNEKYFYIFYLLLSPSLELQPGWYSVYGLYNIIKSLTYNIKLDLYVYDNWQSNYRTDTIDLRTCTDDTLKNTLYNYYINDNITFIPSSTTLQPGILDNFYKNYGVYYSINTNNTGTNSQVFNLVYDYDSDTLISQFSNNLGTIYSNTTTTTWSIFTPTDKDIIPFDIDFYNNSIPTNININYYSLGFLLGFRPNKNNFILSSNFNLNQTIINGQNIFNINDNSYILLNINNWGNIKSFNKNFLSKIIFTSIINNYKIDGFINSIYNFKQPIDIQILDIELTDYLNNPIILNGDFSMTIKLKQILNMDNKREVERKHLFFN
jgi:hypothetical protein